MLKINAAGNQEIWKMLQMEVKRANGNSLGAAGTCLSP